MTYKYGREDEEIVEEGVVYDLSMNSDAEKDDESKIADMKRLLGTVPEELINLYSSQNYAECEPWCDRIIEEEPLNCVAMFYKADILERRGEFEEASGYCDRIVIRAPFMIHAWELIARNYIRKHEYEAARKALFSGVNLAPYSGWSWCLIAITYFVEDIDEGVEMALKAGEIQANDKSTVLFTKGYLHEKRGETDEAVFAYAASQAYSAKEGKSVSDTEASREAILRMLG